MDDMRPTEEARTRFGGVKATAANARLFADDNDEGLYKEMIADSLHGLAFGLEAMATGLRATYILLEKIEHQQRTGRP